MISSKVRLMEGRQFPPLSKGSHSARSLFLAGQLRLIQAMLTPDEYTHPEENPESDSHLVEPPVVSQELATLGPPFGFFTVLGMFFGLLVFWFCSFLLGVCKQNKVFCYHTKSRDGLFLKVAIVVGSGSQAATSGDSLTRWMFGTRN